MKERQILLDIIKQHFASVVWTHKIQEKQSDIYVKAYRTLQTINIIVASLTSCGIVSIIFTNYWLLDVVTALLSFITIGISAYFKSFDLNAMQKQHKDAANHFIVIRNELLGLIAEIHLGNNSVDDISSKAQSIIKELNDLYLVAPSTSNKAVSLASEALNIKNEYTYSEEDIDRFLPLHLRGKLKEDS